MSGRIKAFRIGASLPLVPSATFAAAGTPADPSGSSGVILGAALAFLVGAGIAGYLGRRRCRELAARLRDLRLVEERARLCLEGSGDAAWDWDLVNDRVERSPLWAAMLGYAPGDIAPTPAGLVALLHPDDVPRFEAGRKQLLAGAVDRGEFEYRLRCRSGEWRWILARGRVVARDAAGRPLRFAGTHTDISKSKATEAALVASQQELKRSAQLLAQTQLAARVGGWETDLRTGTVYWTEETYRIHETTPAEYQPARETLYRFYEPNSRAALRAAAERAIREGTPYALELELITAKGRPIHVHTTGVAEFEGDRVVRLHGSFRDITAEKSAALERESLLRKMVETQKLESLGLLAGGIAHDFNNLLTIVSTSADLIRMDPATAEERLRHIDSAVQRAAGLCRQMLAYAGQAGLERTRVDLSTLAREAVELVRASLPAGTQVEFAPDPQLPAVLGAPAQLRQILVNLILNASEALSGEGGLIRLVTRAATPTPGPEDVFHSFGLPPGPAVCCEVADTGSGMPAETLARIFDPFFTTKFAGRGLGLPAVLGLVRVHRGALAVRSTPGIGTLFRVFLPLAPDPVVEAAAPPAVPAPSTDVLTERTILVADDEPAVLVTVAAILRRAGYLPETAADGADAVARFRAEPGRFSAALLDLTMPRLDGAAAAREIRALAPDLPIVVMSGFSEVEIAARVHELGRIGVLHKPFTRDTLLGALAGVSA